MTNPAASGIFKQTRYAVESTWNTPVAAGGTSYLLRRVSSTLSPDIAAFRSNEIQPDRQVHTFRHGTQMVRGALRGELSPLTYKDFFGALFGADLDVRYEVFAISIDYLALAIGGALLAAWFRRRRTDPA